MGEVKQINIKHRTHYYLNDINIKNFDVILLKIDKNHTKTLVFTTLDILQIKKTDDCKNIHSVNPLYLFIDHASGYIEEKSGNKYF